MHKKGNTFTTDAAKLEGRHKLMLEKSLIWTHLRGSYYVSLFKYDGIQRNLRGLVS